MGIYFVIIIIRLSQCANPGAMYEILVTDAWVLINEDNPVLLRV